MWEILQYQVPWETATLEIQIALEGRIATVDLVTHLKVSIHLPALWETPVTQEQANRAAVAQPRPLLYLLRVVTAKRVMPELVKPGSVVIREAVSLPLLVEAPLQMLTRVERAMPGVQCRHPLPESHAMQVALALLAEQTPVIV